jgi:hypothetical protein
MTRQEINRAEEMYKHECQLVTRKQISTAKQVKRKVADELANWNCPSYSTTLSQPVPQLTNTLIE